MSIILGVDRIKEDAPVPNLLVRRFAIISACFIIAGIVLLSVAVALIDPASSASAAITGNRRSQRAAGIFTLCIIPLIIIPSVHVRIRYAKDVDPSLRDPKKYWWAVFGTSESQRLHYYDV